MYCCTVVLILKKTLTDGGISFVCAASIYIKIVPSSIGLIPNPLITDKQNGFTGEITHTCT